MAAPRAKKKIASVPNIVNGVTLIQPNRVTNTSYTGFTLIMHKIFTAIQLELQQAVKHSMSNLDLAQLELFSEHSSDILLKIPYKEIIKDNTQYRDVRKALVSMASLTAEIPYTDNSGKKMLRITGLLKADIPAEADYNEVIDIKLDKKIARLLVEVDKNATGNPINFTKFSYEVAQASTCQHTPPIYKLLAAWKTKEFFKIKYSELRTNLGIGEEQYKRYNDFVKRVLVPAYSDLKNCGSDVWFEFEHKGFKSKQKGEIWLHFKVITTELQQLIDKRTENIRYVLRNFGLNPSQNSVLENILNNQTISRENIYTRITEIEDFIYKNNSDPKKEPIVKKEAYMVSSLQKAFAEKS